MPHHEGNWTNCYTCDSEMWLPMSLYDAAIKGREKIVFYCPYGHSQHFVSGESKEAILRRERDRLQQQLAERDDSIRHWIDETDKARKALGKERTALRKVHTRVAGGVCPCCNRSFAKLAAHMKTKHPEFNKEAA